MTLALIGLVGGIITGLSPCVLPVLPVVFLGGGSAKTEPGPDAVGARRRPYLIVLGLTLSFAVFTLFGSLILMELHLPDDSIRWAGLTVLVLVGLGLLIPPLGHLIERPFYRFPQRVINTDRNGFVLGLALGAVFVPCAGPVLAAITVAGATGHIGIHTIGLTLGFAVGTAIPLLAFALAGRGMSQRLKAFRRHQVGFRAVSGVVMIGLAVALTFNISDIIQRDIPNYTQAVGNSLEKNAAATTQGTSATLASCQEAAYYSNTGLEQCGAAPAFKGIEDWWNTPSDKPLTLAQLKGKVVIVDFWAYSCINCQRAIPRVVGWYQAYHDSGFEVIGVHTPEYAFERVTGNVAKGAADLGITYPVALDNGYSTWTNYRNRYWPAEYLIDASGTVRHIKFGEGDYDGTEKLIRQLLTGAKPDVKLPHPVDAPDTTPQASLTPETYFGVGKVVNYGGAGVYDEGSATFDYPPALAADKFALCGPWSLDYQGATADGDNSAIKLNYHAKDVYIVVGGTGTVTVVRDGKPATLPISGPPTAHQIVAGDQAAPGTLEVRPSKGLQVFSFTYG